MHDDILKSIREQRLHKWEAWQTRLVVWTAALLTGLVIVAFSELTDNAIRFFLKQADAHAWLPLLTLPLGGMGVVWCTRRHFAGAEGSGIPQAVAALEVPALRDRLLSLRVVAGKIGLGAIALGCGFSTGREGPCVQVGASLMHSARRWLPANSHVTASQLIIAGGAAGIAAAFNTPLAGIVFAIEEMSRDYEQRSSSVALAAIVIAGIASISLLGNHTYFGRITVSNIDSHIIGAVIACGLLCGIVGGSFSRLLCASGRPWRGHLGRLRRLHPLLFAGLCGLLVALLGLGTDGSVYGSGYAQTQALLEQGASLPWYYPLAKIGATMASCFSGIPGGIFAPTLAIGAGIGHDLAPAFHTVMPAAILALCMTGFLAAVTQAPITSFIIVMEMIDGHEMVISLIAVALIARLVSGLFSRPLYGVLVHNLLQGAPEMQATTPAGEDKTGT